MAIDKKELGLLMLPVVELSMKKRFLTHCCMGGCLEPL